MPENEFEKKISTELNELKLKPSEKVWLQVEQRIKKKKKRRVFLIIFFFIGIALLAWWQRENIFGDGGVVIAKEKLKNEAINKTEPVSDKPANPGVQKEQIKLAPGDEEVEQSSSEKLNRQIKEDDFTLKEKREKPKSSGEMKPIHVNRDQENEKLAIFISEPVNQKQTDPSSGIIKSDSAALKETKVSEAEIIKLESIIIISADEKITEQKIAANVKADTISQNEIKTDSVLQAAINIKTDSKWKWGINFTPGISSLKENFVSLDMTKSADALDYTGSPNSGSGQINVPAWPTVSKPGFAFQLGGFVQRQLSPRTSLLLALQYGYYSDRIHIGSAKDSVLNNNYFDNSDADKVYSAANASNDYTNHYHFLELPVLFRWQLNKNNSRPFAWDVGFAISRMVTTNALVYDTAYGGIYSNSKKAFNKTQFKLSTGLSWTILNKNSIQWSVGPVADFFTSRLQKNSLDGRDYVMFIGLRSAILFSSKK